MRVIGTKRWANRAVVAALLLYCGALLANLLLRPRYYQLDFKKDYYAAKAFAAGLDPYDGKVIAELASDSILLHRPFVYPPAVLFFFLPFTLVSYGVAYYVYLGLKCVVLVALIRLWQKRFLPNATGPRFYVFCLLAFNGTLYIDLIAGNVSLLQQLLMWLAFDSYLRGRLVRFSVLIVAASLFRLVPIAFLGLLLLPDHKKKHLIFCAAAAVFVAYLGVQCLADHQLAGRFSHQPRGIAKERAGNLATLALLADVSDQLAHATGIAVPPRARLLVFLALAATVTIVTWRAYRVAKASGTDDLARISLFLACLLYILFLPRLKGYSYVVLIAPAYSVLRTIQSVKVSHIVLCLLVLPAGSRLPGLNWLAEYGAFWWRDYWPLFMAYCVWGVCVRELFRLRGEPADN